MVLLAAIAAAGAFLLVHDVFIEPSLSANLLSLSTVLRWGSFLLVSGVAIWQFLTPTPLVSMRGVRVLAASCVFITLGGMVSPIVETQIVDLIAFKMGPVDASLLVAFVASIVFLVWAEREYRAVYLADQSNGPS